MQQYWKCRLLRNLQHEVYTQPGAPLWADPEGDWGSGPPPPSQKKSKQIGFLTYTGPDPPNHKATKPAFIFGPLSTQRATPEGGGVGVRTPLKNHKNIGFLSNTGPDPLKNNNQASIQFCGIIGTPAKRHLKWCFAGWPMIAGSLVVVFGSSLPSTTNKKKVKVVGPPLTKLSGSTQDKFWTTVLPIGGVHVYIYIYR